MELRFCDIKTLICDLQETIFDNASLNLCSISLFLYFGKLYLEKSLGKLRSIKTKAAFMKENPAFVCYSLDFNDSYS